MKQIVQKEQTPVCTELVAAFTARLEKEWPAGMRLPSVRQLAKQWGASPVTVHRAIRILIEQGRLTATPRLGVFVAGSQVRRFAIGAPEGLVRPRDDAAVKTAANRALPQLERFTIAMVHGSTAGEDLSLRMVHGFRREMEPTGCRLVTALQSPLWENWPPQLPGRVDAVVVFNPSSNLVWPLDAGALTIVTTADHISVAARTGYDVVGIDQEQVGILAGQTLRAAGSRRPGYLGRGTARDIDDPPVAPYDSTSARRLRGFELAWREQPVTIANLYSFAYGPTSGANAVRQFLALNPRPDAVFAACDELALGFLLGAQNAGLQLGRDFLLVGCDGQRIGQELSPRPLTTVEVPAHEMGRRAAQLLMERLGDPTLPPRRLAMGCGMLPGGTATRFESTDLPTSS